MNSQINPKDAAAIIAELAKSLRATHTLRVEDDKLETCKIKPLRARKYLVSEQIFFVHQKDKDGNLDVKRLEDLL